MKDLINSRHISELIRHANPNRAMADLPRRVLKLLEEIGEVAQAYLCATSASPTKPKTWDDVREEAVDVLIVTFDVLMTPGIESETADVIGYDMASPDDDIPDLLRQIARWTCDLGDHLSFSLWDSEAMARCANLLTDRVFNDDASLIQEVERKLDKWIKSQKARPAELADTRPS